MITTTVGSWQARYYGGRLADIYWGGTGEAVDCIQVGAYDWQRGELIVEPDRAAIRSALTEWVEDQGDCFYENVVAYR